MTCIQPLAGNPGFAPVLRYLLPSVFCHASSNYFCFGRKPGQSSDILYRSLVKGYTLFFKCSVLKAYSLYESTSIQTDGLQLGTSVRWIPRLILQKKQWYDVLIWFFTSHQQSFSYIGTCLPGWGSNTRPFGLSRVKHSTTEPLRSPMVWWFLTQYKTINHFHRNLTSNILRQLRICGLTPHRILSWAFGWHGSTTIRRMTLRQIRYLIE